MAEELLVDLDGSGSGLSSVQEEKAEGQIHGDGHDEAHLEGRGLMMESEFELVLFV